MATLAALCACLCCARVSAEEAGSRTQNTRYAQLLKQGVDAFTQGEWQAARAAFERAHTIEPTARTYRGLALCDFELGNYAHSVRELEAALSDSRRPLTPELRTQVLRTLERAMRDAGRVHLMLPEDVSELRVDGNAEPLPEGGVVLLDPGPHTLEVSVEGRETITRQLEIENGATQNLILALAPARHAGSQPAAADTFGESAPAPLRPFGRPQPTAAGSSAPRIWSWVALGLTGVAGAGALGLAVATSEKHAAFSEQRDAYAAHLAAAERGTPPSDQLKRSGQRLELLTNLSLIGCAVLGAATVTLFMLEQPSSEKAVQISAAVHPGGVVLQGQF